VIELRPGVAFCLRKFHTLISDLVRGAWARYVRQQNLGILGEVTIFMNSCSAASG
jgi:hypothetical protein